MHEEHQRLEEVPIPEEFPMHGGPSAWFLKYFGKLNESMVRIKQCQEEIIQTQKKHGEYIDRLGDFYENLHEQQTMFNQQYSNQMAEVEAQLEGLWVHIVPPLPIPPFNASNAPPRPPYRAPPY